MQRSIVTPPRAKVRRVEDSATPRKETRGVKLSGHRFSRATPVVVRRIGEDKPDITAEDLARNVYDRDGLGPYSELRGRMYA